MNCTLEGCRPVRINKTLIKIRVLNTQSTVRDVDFREARENRVYSEPVEVIGQIVGMEQVRKLMRTQTGDSLPSTPHFVFRFCDLEEVSPGFLPKKGDRIVEVDGVAVDFNIIKAIPGSLFGGLLEFNYAKPILLHVDVEQQRKKLGSI